MFLHSVTPHYIMICVWWLCFSGFVNYRWPQVSSAIHVDCQQRSRDSGPQSGYTKQGNQDTNLHCNNDTQFLLYPNQIQVRSTEQNQTSHYKSSLAQFCPCTIFRHILWLVSLKWKRKTRETGSLETRNNPVSLTCILCIIITVPNIGKCIHCRLYKSDSVHVLWVQRLRCPPQLSACIYHWGRRLRSSSEKALAPGCTAPAGGQLQHPQLPGPALHRAGGEEIP